MDEWEEEGCDRDEDACLCEDASMDPIEGSAYCSRCGRFWMMSAEEIKRELRFQAEAFEAMADECTERKAALL